jgi:predicted ATP-dependent serine protease
MSKQMSPIEEFVTQLKLSNYDFDNSINIRCLDSEKLPRFEHSYNLRNAESLEQLKKLFLASKNNAWHYYYIPNNSNGFTINDVVNCQVLFVEFDDIPKIEQFKKIKDLGIPFTYCVETFKSIHFYWTLTEALPIDTWVNYQKQLIERLGSDKSISNSNRLMRMAGMPYADQGFNINLIRNDKDSDFKKIDVSVFNFSEPLPVEKKSYNKIDRSYLANLKYGEDCPISDLSQQFADNIEQLFNWNGHNFSSDGRGKYKGSCPFHDSKSGSSFWVEQNESGCYSFACPTCTDNKKKNLLFYRNWLKGTPEQPKGNTLAIIEKEIQIDVFGEIKMQAFSKVLASDIANEIKKTESIETLSSLEKFESFVKEKGYETEDLKTLYNEVNFSYVSILSNDDPKFDEMDIDQYIDYLSEKAIEDSIKEKKAERESIRYNDACLYHVNRIRRLIERSVELESKFEEKGMVFFTDLNVHSDYNIEDTCKIKGIEDKKKFKKFLEDYEEKSLSSKELENLLKYKFDGVETTVDYLIPNYIAKNSLIMLGADPGSGKSLLAADLALAVIQPESKKFLGETCTDNNSSVLYINNDESIDTFSNRLMKLGVEKEKITSDNPRLVYKNNITDLKNQIYKIEQSIIKMNQTGDCKLVIVDSLTSVTVNGVEDENHANFAKPLVSLAEIASRYKTSIVLLHHTNKSGFISGTNRLTSACHQVYVINKQKRPEGETIDNDPVRFLKCIKNRTGILFTTKVQINPVSLWKSENAYALTDLQKIEKGMYENAIEQTFVKNITKEDIEERSELISYEDLQENNKGLEQNKVHQYIEAMVQNRDVEFNISNFKYKSKGKFRDKLFKMSSSKLGFAVDSSKTLLSVDERKIDANCETVTPEKIESSLDVISEIVESEDEIIDSANSKINEFLATEDLQPEVNRDESLNDKDSKFFNFIMDDGITLREHLKHEDGSIDCFVLLTSFQPWVQLNTEFEIYRANSPEFLKSEAFLQHSKKLYIKCVTSFDIYTIIGIEKTKEFSDHILTLLEICKAEKVELFESYGDSDFIEDVV